MSKQRQKNNRNSNVTKIDNYKYKRLRKNAIELINQ